VKEVTYRRYLLVVLTIILAFSYVDRNVFSVVQEQIKIDLHLTDTEVGAINGIGYAIFFGLMGIPIARWADRGDRVAIIVATTGVWSVAVALCGQVGSFVQLFLIRIGVAAGEGGCGPPAMSLIPTHFPRAERPRAAARYLLGGYLGATLGYFLGGWLNQLYGWRRTFLLIGLPGLVLAALAGITLREPRRYKGNSTCDHDLSGGNVHTLGGVIAALWRLGTIRHVLLFYVAWYFCGWGLQMWSPTFFVRIHSMQPAEIGTGLAVAYGSTGLLGSWIGGELASRYARQDERRQLIGASIAFLLEGLLTTSVYLIPDEYVALGVLGLANLFESMAIGPVAASVQTLVAPSMRATAQTLVTVLPNFVGLGLGPLLVGALSDALHPLAGDGGLRYALLALCPGYAWAAFHLWRASYCITRELAIAQREDEVARFLPESMLR
jgi:MFS transporter, Spinster family, sphingosine-1-phosphate transporter